MISVMIFAKKKFNKTNFTFIPPGLEDGDDSAIFALKQKRSKKYFGFQFSVARKEKRFTLQTTLNWNLMKFFIKINHPEIKT